MTSRNRFVLIVLAAVLAMATAATAGRFVSLAGKFVITYPENWQQIDYQSVDYFLYQGRQPDQRLQYDAAFAPMESNPWYQDAYLVLAVDTISGLGQADIDSMLESLSASLGKPVRRTGRAELFSELRQGQFAYDNSSQTAAVIIELASERPGDKHSMLVMHFYDRGIANFYFYSPDSSLQRNIPVFSDIVSSFSTDDVEAAMTRETLKVADPEKFEHESDGGGSRTAMWIPTTGVVIILIVIAIAVRRRRTKR